MQFHIKKSNLAIFYIALIFAVCGYIIWFFLQKSAWRLASIFLIFSSIMLVLELYTHLILFVDTKLVSHNNQLLWQNRQATLLRVVSLKYFSKYFILLKIDRKFFNAIPLWRDSLTTKDWTALAIAVQKI